MESSGTVKCSSIEVRYPLVVGYNDGECEKIALTLSGMGKKLKVKVLQYHQFSASRYDALGMTNTLPAVETTANDVATAVRILRSHGINAINGISDD